MLHYLSKVIYEEGDFLVNEVCRLLFERERLSYLRRRLLHVDEDIYHIVVLLLQFLEAKMMMNFMYFCSFNQFGAY